MNYHSERSRPASATILAAAAWALAYFLTLVVLKTYQPAEWLKVVLSLLPAVPFAFFLIFVISEIRNLDELHRRVHLEALAIAFPLTILLLMTLGLLDIANILSPDNWIYRNIWYFLPLLYAIGLAVAWRRYQ